MRTGSRSLSRDLYISIPHLQIKVSERAVLFSQPLQWLSFDSVRFKQLLKTYFWFFGLCFILFIAPMRNFG
jgi:hypothetical protein